MSAAIFDLDGTLIVGSSERLFIAHLARLGLLRGAQARAALGFLVAQIPACGMDTLRKNKAYLSGLDVEAVRGLAHEFVASVLLRRLRPDMIARLEAHRGGGEGVALLSGAPDFLVAALAEHLDIRHWRATLCAQSDGRFAPLAPIEHPFAADKIPQAEALCAELGVTLSSCTAYGDSRHDLALLRRAARPVAVYPDRTLRRVARHAGWSILPEPPGSTVRGRLESLLRLAS